MPSFPGVTSFDLLDREPELVEFNRDIVQEDSANLMTASVLLIRADASVAMGSGHVMRCLALAQAWQDAGGRAVFAMADVTPAIHERLTAESSGVLTLSASAGSAEDSKQTIELAQAQNAKWLVVDGYQFDAEYYQRSMKAANFKLLFLDDFGHAKHYSADVVLNQNVSAQQGLYSDCEVHTRVLLGPKYALLRREFSGWRGWKKVTSPHLPARACAHGRQ